MLFSMRKAILVLSSLILAAASPLLVRAGGRDQVPSVARLHAKFRADKETREDCGTPSPLHRRAEGQLRRRPAKADVNSVMDGPAIGQATHCAPRLQLTLAVNADDSANSEFLRSRVRVYPLKAARELEQPLRRKRHAKQVLSFRS